MKNRLFYAAAALTMLVSAPAFAQSVSYTGGAALFPNLGDDGRNSGFDQIAFTSIAGMYNGPGTYGLNFATLTAGVNRDTPVTLSGVFNGLTGTFNGQSFTYSVNYTGTIADVDTFTLGGNTIDVFGTSVYLDPLTLTAGASGIDSGVLNATVAGVTGAVPEPTTWAMMMLGFGMIGFGLRRRQSKVTTNVQFA